MSESRPDKKRKLTGLNSDELQHAYDTILKLKESMEDEEGVQAWERVNDIATFLESKLGVPQSLAFSRMTESHLDQFNITATGNLILKSDIEERIATAASLGQDKLWSSVIFHRHLQLLESLVSHETDSEASARIRIDAFLFRVSAMLPQEKLMFITTEHKVPAVTVNPSTLRTLSGFLDYSAIVVTDPDLLRILRTSLSFRDLRLRLPSGFFVIEAKKSNPSDHVPQAVCEMYACGKFFQKKVLRGAVTNGHVWIFLLIKLNDGDGASFIKSEPLKLISPGLIEEHEPDLIAGVLAYWIENSFEELGDGDWFRLV